MDEKLIQKLSFLSRISQIDNNIFKDFEKIIQFFEKIVDFNFEKIDCMKIEYMKKVVLAENLREDIEKCFSENKIILRNFSNEEDDFCIVSLTVEKDENKNEEKIDE